MAIDLNGVDPILAAVLGKRMRSITNEMAIGVERSSRSPIFSEAKDFVTGLFDAKGRMLEQIETIPVISFSIQPSLERILEYYGDDIHAGDVILHNDVFSGNNQLADLGVFKPIFHVDRLVGWAVTKGHMADIGGSVPGTYNPRAKEIWQEAFRVTPVKIYERGALRQDVWDLVFANIRWEIVPEDAKALVGGTVLGERKLLEVVERYGADVFESHMEYLFTAVEERLRAGIRELAEGTYSGEGSIFSDGFDATKEYRVKVTVTIEDGEMHFDFTGTDPQAPGYTNAPPAVSMSMALTVVLMVVAPDMPHNAGMYRPFHFTFPPGTVVNPDFPAATGFGNHVSDAIFEALMRAFTPLAPDRVIAGWCRHLSCIWSGWDPRVERPYTDVGFFNCRGGAGGTYGVDGYDHLGLVPNPMMRTQDLEVLELQTPFTMLRYEFLPGSAGAGEFRGGLGVLSRFRVDGETLASCLGDGLATEGAPGAYGLFGGAPGATNRLLLSFPDGRTYEPGSKELVELEVGTIWEQEAGGGGGFGDPFRRPAAKVAEEVRDGLLSAASAECSYGVAVDAAGRLDPAATERLRASRPVEGYEWLEED
ncbi:MAG: hydantoinase B/oxoprolinase family protein [Actinobacteria bacterium]|nr:hydantoinase B/oxoprolinase family protein [Actinomycetota bacterium]